MVTLRADPSGQVEQGAWEVGSLRACGWCYLWVCSLFGQVSKNLRTSFVWVAPPPGPPGSPPPRFKKSCRHHIEHRIGRRPIYHSSSNPRSSILEWVCTGTRHTSLLCIPPGPPPPPPPSSSSRSGEGQAGFEDSASPLRAVSGPG